MKWSQVSVVNKLAREINKIPRKKRPQTYRAMCVKKKHDILQADLLDITRLSRDNNGYKFILLLIDEYSRYFWTFPLKSKQPAAVAQALKSVFDRVKPRVLVTDRGMEFKGREMKKFLEERNIQLWHLGGSSKAFLAERQILTLKTELAHLFTRTGEFKWVSHLPDIVRRLNNRVHSTTGLKPSGTTNSQKHYQMVNKHCIKLSTTQNARKPKFAQNDTVRISLERSAFSKRHQGNFSTELFQIYRIFRTSPPTFLLMDSTGQIIVNRFYENELQSSIVHKIIKKGKLQSLVQLTNGQQVYVPSRLVT